MINQIKNGPSHGKTFSNQNSFDHFIVIDDDDAYTQADAYRSVKKPKRCKVCKAEFLTAGGFVNTITSWRRLHDPEKTSFKRRVDLDICCKHIDTIK